MRKQKGEEEEPYGVLISREDVPRRFHSTAGITTQPRVLTNMPQVHAAFSAVMNKAGLKLRLLAPTSLPYLEVCRSHAARPP